MRNYSKNKLELKYLNMIREEDDKKPVCSSFLNPSIGFIVSPWYKDCPAYEKISKMEIL